MYSSFENFLKVLDAGDNEIIKLSQEDPRIAIGILLYSTVQVDGRVKREETQLYRHLLESYLNVSEDEFLMFEDIVSETCNKPDSINSIIQIIREMPESKRREVLKLMKDISLSDKQFHEFEVNLVSRISTLLGLDEAQ
jgi:uncharacterized tellurite resistance protein B-like protein